METLPGLSIQALADGINLDRSTISNNLRLLKLPGLVLDRVATGEMAAHAAREFLCLQTEDHSHDDIMRRVIEEISGTALGTAPDWRTPNVRKRIWSQIERSTVKEWRRLGGEENGSYGGSHRAMPRFDVEEFKRAHPGHVHHIPHVPFDSDGKSDALNWTCNVAEWQRWQMASTQELIQAPGGNGKVSDRAQKSGQPAESFLMEDPVVQKVVGTAAARETARAKVVAGLKTPDEESGDQQSPASAYVKLNTFLIDAVQSDPLPGNFQRIHQGDEYKALLKDLTTTHGLAPWEIHDAFVNFSRRMEEKIRKEAMKSAPKSLTEEQRTKLGARGRVSSIDRLQGFKKRLSGPYGVAPFYFNDPKECTERCMKGATYTITYPGDSPCLTCTNESCYTEKLETGRGAFAKQFEKQAAVDDRDDDALAMRIHKELGSSPMAGILATVLLVELEFDYV